MWVSSSVAGLVIDLHLVAVIHRHPSFARLDGNADKDSGVVVVIAHLVNNANHAISKLAAGPVKQPHAAMGADQPIFHGHFAGPDVLPAGQVLAIEKLLPSASLCGRGTGHGQPE